MQGFVVRRQLQHKQKEMLNLMAEQQQRQVQCLEMLKLHHLQSRRRQELFPILEDEEDTKDTTG